MTAKPETQQAGEPSVSAAEMNRRTIRRSDYVSCDQAFIDCRTPGSDLKENYSIIGAGVTQSSEQVVNLREPHGFNVGAAAMPNGVTNNLHLHFTAEVFLDFRGDWLLRWGNGGADGEYRLRGGDIASVPTWIFRGFTNVGADDGWLFTVLGLDDTGGIVWDPSVIAEAATHGLYLSGDNRLLDTANGDTVDEGTALLPPVPARDLAALRAWSPGELASRVVAHDRLAWSAHSFLCGVLPGGRAEFAPVIGYGMSEHRDDVPPIHNPHGFNVAWLRAAPGEGLLTHRHDEPAALIGHTGRWRLTVNRGPREVATEFGPHDTVSVPAGAWRRLEALGGEPAELVAVNRGDGRVRLDWDAGVRERARAAGLAHDAGGYLGPVSVIGPARAKSS